MFIIAKLQRIEKNVKGFHKIAKRKFTWKSKKKAPEPEKFPSHITAEEYQTRRKKLIELCGINKPGKGEKCMLFPSAPLCFRSNDVIYPFHQNAEFSYLCGYQEPNCLLAMFKDQSHSEGFRSILFVPMKSEQSEIQDGKVFTLKEISEQTGVSEARYLNDIISIFHAYLKIDTSLMLWYFYEKAVNLHIHCHFIMEALKLCRVVKIEDPSPYLWTVRSVKSKHEIYLISKSVNITEQSFGGLFTEFEGGKWKRKVTHLHELSTEFEWHCQRKGGKMPILELSSKFFNQTRNSSLFVLGSCEYQGYRGYMGRPLGIEGKPNPEHAILKCLLEEVHWTVIIQYCNKGRSLADIKKFMTLAIYKFLNSLTLTPGPLFSFDPKTKIAVDPDHFYENHVKKHGMSYLDCEAVILGMEFCDTNLKQKFETYELIPGMVIIIKTGVCIPKELIPKKLQERFGNTSLQFVDSVLITEDQPFALSSEL